MKSNNKICIVSFIILILLLPGCLDDLTLPPITGELDNTAKLLMYFEQQGDYINSDLNPLLVNADELYNNLNSYRIIDVRNSDIFGQGHIENAVNILNDSLYAYMEKIKDSSYSKIVIVSKNGQESAYYSTLLKLAGFNNVFSLNFGMAYWHINFADEWLASLKDASGLYVDEEFEKNDFTDFPASQVDNPELSIEEIVKNRIKLLLSRGYNIDDVYVDRLPSNIDNNYYFVCYGSQEIYLAGKLGGYLGHPVGTTYYIASPIFDFRSIRYLQTLPTDRITVMYSYNGQLSSSMVAYLRILGYDARSLLFGACQLFYPRMIGKEQLAPFAFDSSAIRNFDYVIGN